MGRRASIIASSNVNPSDGDDEGTEKNSENSKNSENNPDAPKSPEKSAEKGSLSGSMDSNRSQLSSKSELNSGPPVQNGKTEKAERKGKSGGEEMGKDFEEYDDIENQLIRDQEKELEYLNGLDEPINKSDLPLLVRDENENGPYMNEPMKLR